MQNQLCATDLNRVFAYCPIAIAGGLFLLSIEVIKEEEPACWQKLFGFVRGGMG
ncbi:MAG: hypothetical protein KF731_16020 [Thauera sp.]|nr:hypothetical protein [Thauera sp.]